MQLSIGQQLISQLVGAFGAMMSTFFTAIATNLLVPVLTQFSTAIFGANAGG